MFPGAPNPIIKGSDPPHSSSRRQSVFELMKPLSGSHFAETTPSPSWVLNSFCLWTLNLFACGQNRLPVDKNPQKSFACGHQLVFNYPYLRPRLSLTESHCLTETTGLEAIGII